MDVTRRSYDLTEYHTNINARFLGRAAGKGSMNSLHLRYKDVLKCDLKSFDIRLETRTAPVMDRPRWLPCFTLAKTSTLRNTLTQLVYVPQTGPVEDIISRDRSQPQRKREKNLFYQPILADSQKDNLIKGLHCWKQHLHSASCVWVIRPGMIID